MRLSVFQRKIQIIQKKTTNQVSYNIISLGSSGVGKTSIFKRLLDEKFELVYQPTIGLEVSVPYFVKYKGQKYKLFFYDSGGQEKFMESLPKSYMRKSDGVLFVFDLTNKQSFEDLEEWYEIYKNEKEYVVGVLLGNKCDMPSQIDQKEIKKFAKEHEFEYLETSSKLDKKIKKAIATLLEEIVESKAHYDSLSLSSDTSEKLTFELDSNKFKKESFCKRFCNKLANLFS